MSNKNTNFTTHVARNCLRSTIYAFIKYLRLFTALLTTTYLVEQGFLGNFRNFMGGFLTGSEQRIELTEDNIQETGDATGMTISSCVMFKTRIL
jgi:hypothetical protein